MSLSVRINIHDDQRNMDIEVAGPPETGQCAGIAVIEHGIEVPPFVVIR